MVAIFGIWFFILLCAIIFVIALIFLYRSQRRRTARGFEVKIDGNENGNA